jgi:hypothetical protein
MMRRAAPALVAAALLLLTGCASAGVDETLTAAVSDSISSSAAAQLGLELDERGRILPGTLTALLGDMEEALADTERELQLHQAADPADAAYRADALTAVRGSLEAVHIAQTGEHAAALAGISESLAQLKELEGGG